MSRESNGTETKSQVIDDVAQLYQRIVELESANAECERLKEALRSSNEQIQALRESDKWHLLLLNSITDGCWALDGEWHYTWVNEAGAHLVGTSPDKMVGRKLTDLFPGIGKTDFFAAYKRSMRKHTVESVSAPFTFPDGRTGVYEVRVYPVPSGILCIGRDLTESTQMNAALREREANYKEFVSSLPQVVFEMDESGNLIFANLNAFDVFGYTEDDFANGLNALQMIVSEDRDRAKTNIVRALSGELMSGIEYTAQRKDGSTFPVVIHSSPLILNGKPVGLRGILIDITERKRAEKLISDQSELALALNAVTALDKGLCLCLESSLHASGMDCGGIYLVDETTGGLDLAYHTGLSPDFIKSSSHFTEDSPSTRLVMEGKPIYTRHTELGVPLDVARSREGLRAIAILPLRYEDRVIGCLNIASHTIDEVPGLFRGALEAITAQIGSSIARLKAEAALKESEAKFRNLADESPSMIFINKKGRLVYVNKRCEEIMGYTREEFSAPDFDFHTLHAPHSQDVVETNFRKHMRGEEVVPYEITLIPKAGKRIEAIITSKLITYRGESAILGIVTDITDRKEAEKERERLLNELEAKTREMEHFTYTASHELRAPLVVIQGYASLLRRDLAAGRVDKMEADLTKIEEGVSRMDKYLEQTLELSRIGRVANPPEDVPFGALVKEALKLVAEQLKAHNIDVSIMADFPTVHVDRMRITEALQNLILNSIKYRGEQPHPKIEIGYQANDNETVFYVQDNGIGLAKSQHERVFDLFYVVDKSGKGTGAGLAIVKRIIEVHGGRIWIESEKGKGCTVCFTLPVN